jgi:O-antigen ligase
VTTDVAIAARPRRAGALAAGFAALLAAAVWAAVSREWTAAALAATAAGAVALALRSPDALFGLWIAATPWASFVLKWPDERSLVTFDRVVVVAIAAGYLARARRERGPLPAPGLFELAWAAFAAVALASVVTHAEAKGLALRTAVDAFAMPLVLFYALRAGFDVARGRAAVFWGAIVLALALPWVGLYEFVAARDVMVWKGASIFRTGIVRANGPFATDNSYAIVAALAGLFLLWLPSAMGLALDRTARLAHRVAVASALGAACIPAFRTIMGAIVTALALPYALAGRVRTLARAACVGILVLVAALPVLVPLSRTATFRDRISDPSSAFSRAATYLAAIDVVEDHPLTGVGLTNYHSYFERKYGTAWYVDVEAVADVGAESYPHNNVLAVWAELGTVGVFFYLLASIALAGVAWRRRAVGALALMVAYWIPGMTLQSGYYADLNLYYFAMLAVLLAPREP